MQWTHDIAVVGGGPAGTAFARALARMAPELRIVVLERSRYDVPRVGETLPPQCRVLLERLGIWEDFQAEGHLPAFGSQSAWGVEAAASQEFMTTLQRNGWHLDRARFDAFMARKAEECGVEMRPGTALRSLRRLEEGWELVPERGEALQVRLLVDATGRGASVARKAGGQLLGFDRLVGTMAVLDAGTILDRDTLVEACPEGWWYSALLPERKMAAAFFCDAGTVKELQVNALPGWLGLLREAPLTAARLTGLVHGSSTVLRTWPARSQRLREAAGPDWIAVGDAAAAFDPLSSQGIFFALRSALMAAFAAKDMLAGGEMSAPAIGKYQHYQLTQFTGYWELRRDFYGLERRWPDRAFWRERHAPLTLDPRQGLVFRPEIPAKPLFFSREDLRTMQAHFPEGATARECMALLQTIRPDLPPGHALEGLQTLLADGHLVSIPQFIPQT